jgi:hypothetical protein
VFFYLASYWPGVCQTAKATVKGRKMIIPGGLASEASVKETKYCVQTEFAKRPKPRVTTTITINGEVVEKVENIWDRLPQTEEDKKEVETFLKKQHQQVLENIKNKKAESANLGLEPKGSAEAKGTSTLKIEEELSRIPGIYGWILLSEDNGMKANRFPTKIKGDYSDIVRSVKHFSELLSSDTTLGNFQGGILEDPDSRMVFLPLHTQFLAVQVESQTDVKKLIQSIKAVA